MGRRHQHRQEYTLDSGNIEPLSQEDIRAVIRAADDLIGLGGRTMVGKILKGSRSKDVLELGHDKNPVYGHFNHLTLPEIGHRVDWMIEQGYLEIQYSGRLPCLSHSDKGLALACRIRSEEWFQMCQSMVTNGGPYLMTFLKDCNRRTIFQLLDRIAAEKDMAFIPLLESWAEIDYKKIVARIRSVIQELQDKAPSRPQTFAICLVDESISHADYALFLKWAKAHGRFFDDVRWVEQEAPGIQDRLILDRMLEPEVCLLTSDRVLHNVALSDSYTSFFIDQEGLVSTVPLEGIKARGILASKEPLSSKVVPLAPPEEQPSLRRLLTPPSAKRQKNLRTKRRRIRNYFGGPENMAEIAATLSMIHTKTGDSLIGIRLRISAISGGIKGLDASENYVLEPGKPDPLAAYGHLLIILIQLQFEKVPLMIFHDTSCLALPTAATPHSPFADLYFQLSEEFSQIEFTPTPKGPQIERLRTKLRNLANSESNEILTTSLTEISELIHSRFNGS